MSTLIAFIKDSYVEMTTKVSWPKYAELQNSSILVLVASLIFAIVVGAMDFVYNSAMEWFYKAF